VHDWWDVRRLRRCDAVRRAAPTYAATDAPPRAAPPPILPASLLAAAVGTTMRAVRAQPSLPSLGWAD
jgi:hypothetical protein